MMISAASTPPGAHLSSEEYQRQREVLDKQRAEPPTYDADAPHHHRTDHSRELQKNVGY